MSDPRIERDYYDNGQLSSERFYVGEVPHGFHRWWHKNGVLASEGQFDMGIPDGVHRQWNAQGELVCSYEIKNGTGIQRRWDPNLEAWSEIPLVDGKWTGRMRMTWSDGEVVGDQYWIRNEKVSKRKYDLACQTDPSLPRYDD